ATAQCGGKPEPAPDHVWLVWGTAAHPMGGALATPVSKGPARGHRESPLPSTPPPRVRRTHGRPPPRTKGCSCSHRGGLGAATDVDRASGTNLGSAGRWDLGSERRPPSLHLIQDHGMGCSGSHGAGCGAFQTDGAAGTVATSSRPHARDDL